MRVPSIWVERYRPTTLNDIVFQDDRQERMLRNYVESGDIPNILLSGVQGTGKTTVSKVLVGEMGVDTSDILRINCSDEKIDALRNKVSAFAMTMPIGKFKVVQLEECDHFSLDAFAMLRGLIEDSSYSCRFIATCNYVNRVIPAVRSRFQEFYFRAPDKEKIALRMVHILDAEKIDFDVDDVLTYIDVSYPDIRKCIQLLQANSINGQLLPPRETSGAGSDWKFSLLDAINAGDFVLARKVVCESATREEHEDVYRFMYDNIDKLKVTDKEAAILTIAEYLRSHALVADTEINLAAMMISISRC